MVRFLLRLVERVGMPRRRLELLYFLEAPFFRAWLSYYGSDSDYWASVAQSYTVLSSARVNAQPDALDDL